MNIGIWQIALVLLAVLLLFGAGKLPKVMGDVGKGIRGFRRELRQDGAADVQPPATESARAHLRSGV